MAKGTTSAVAATLLLVAAVVAAARMRATPSPEAFTSVWDAYPATMISVCPHIPRRPIHFDQLNGRWLVMEKGGILSTNHLCEMDFRVERGRNLTLHISQRIFNDGNLENHMNSTWIMSDENVWRDYADSQMYLFVGYSTGRTLLLTCAVDHWENTTDGYSLALTREPSTRASVFAAARLPGRVETTDRTQCPGE